MEELQRARNQRRREVHLMALRAEAQRLAQAAALLGVERVIMFGSLARGAAGWTSDLDLLLVWDTPLSFVERIAELYRCLQPRGPVDLVAYTPAELETMSQRGFVRQALAEGEVLYAA